MAVADILVQAFEYLFQCFVLCVVLCTGDVDFPVKFLECKVCDVCFSCAAWSVEEQVLRR